jgi:isocitrate dehydrogenase kinase/phosphatase
MLIVLTIVIGLTPAAISLWVCLYSRRQLQQNLQVAAESAVSERFRLRSIRSTRPYNPDEHYVDGIGLVIGDITCQLNARWQSLPRESPFLRCTPNPYGPCKDCAEYEGREYT